MTRTRAGMLVSNRTPRVTYTRPLKGIRMAIQAASRLYQTPESASPHGSDSRRRATHLLQPVVLVLCWSFRLATTRKL